MRLYTTLVILAFLISSCEVGIDTSSPNAGADKPKSPNYFPIHLENSWEYTASEANRTTTTTSTSMFKKTKEVEGEIFYQYTNPQNLFGLSNDSIDVRKEGTAYYLSGSIMINGYKVGIENQKFLDDTANVGDEINTIEATETVEKIAFSEYGLSGYLTPTIDAKVNIKVLSKGSKTVEDVTYDDVLTIQYEIYAKGAVNINVAGIGIDHVLVNESKVTTITQSYANHIGCVYSKVKVDVSELDINSKVVIFGQTIDLSSLIAEYEDVINTANNEYVYILDKYNIRELNSLK